MRRKRSELYIYIEDARGRTKHFQSNGNKASNFPMPERRKTDTVCSSLAKLLRGERADSCSSYVRLPELLWATVVTRNCYTRKVEELFFGSFPLLGWIARVYTEELRDIYVIFPSLPNGILFDFWRDFYGRNAVIYVSRRASIKFVFSLSELQKLIFYSTYLHLGYENRSV